jgi:hypothetical protein
MSPITDPFILVGKKQSDFPYRGRQSKRGLFYVAGGIDT